MNERKPSPPATSPVALIGVPYDLGASYLRGSAAAPQAIRDALHCPSSNTWSELGIDAADPERVEDLGDLDLSRSDPAPATIENAVASALSANRIPLLLGGDHSITFPILQAVASRHTGITLIQFDAHPDLYQELDGRTDSNASPFARILERGLIERLIQVGIRTLNDHQRQQAARFGVQIYGMNDLPEALPVPAGTPIYVSLDLDVLDPAFMPGVSHPEPGGMSTRRLVSLLHSIPAPIIGADLVELNPVRDPSGLSAMTAAKLLKEMIAQVGI